MLDRASCDRVVAHVLELPRLIGPMNLDACLFIDPVNGKPRVQAADATLNFFTPPATPP